MKPIRIVKASYRDCPIEDRKFFNKSRCIVPISVGQPIHEGSKFAATMELINRTFKECVILIDDVVQRHTMRIAEPKLDEHELYNKAKLEGQQWLSRNKKSCDLLDIPFKIITWEKWLNHKNFTFAYKEILNQYNNNIALRQAFCENIEDFLDRYKKNNNKIKFNYDMAFSLCLDYLKEECACMCLWTEEECAFEVYPHGRNKAMSATYKFIIQEKYPHLLKSVALRFKKYTTITNMQKKQSVALEY